MKRLGEILLTVTLGSKKYLRVRDKPRTISVRNSVFMLRSKTAKKEEAKHKVKYEKRKSLRSYVIAFTSIPVLGDFLGKLLLFFII